MPSTNDKHILVVEDEPDGREIISALLNHFGVNADLAPDGEQALDLLADHHYDAAVIDLMLPGIDGLELIQVIRSTPHIAALPCIAVTAYHTSKIKKDAKDAGYNAFYPKPLDDSAFFAELTRILS